MREREIEREREREREREDGSKVKQKVARLLVTKFGFYSLLEIPLTQANNNNIFEQC